MRKIQFLFLLTILTPYLLNSQERNDLGLIAGTSYYMGDYNVGMHFNKPSPAVGVIFRHNTTDLFSLRISGVFGWLRGEHNPSNFYLPNEKPTFSSRLVEIEATAEIGFLSFNTRQPTRNYFTPYVIVGAGMAFFDNNPTPHIPLGIGIKYSPIERWTFGMEWRLHKTVSDNIDGYANLTDPNKRKSFIHNNDWFGIAGIFVTYRLYNQSAICPAYE